MPGNDVAFVAVDGRGSYAVAISSGRTRRIAAVGDDSGTLAWAPDGRRLLISSRGAIYVAANGRARRVAAGFAAVWSPDGQRIAFSGAKGFYVAGADGSGVTLIAPSSYIELAPTVAWSPTGDRIAYVACRAPRGSSACEHALAFDVYISSVATRVRHRVTTTTGFPQCVAWSRAGFLAWMTGERTTAVARPGRRIHTFRPGGGCPVWSPDGHRLAVVSATGIVLLGADGTGRRTVPLPVDATVADPVWSPDGKTVAVLVVPNGGNPTSLAQLYAVRPSDGSVRRVRLPRP
jgi:Tol biopolymer transport system component